jgi:hypothetical protein
MRGHINHATTVLLTAALLSGCGIIPVVAQQTTAAALRPVTAAAQLVKTDLQLMGNLASSAAGPARQITTVARAMPAAAPAAYAAPRTIGFTRPKKERAEVPADWDIMPAELLSKLTTDQAGLQRAAQREASTAIVGETIFWKLDGREGSAKTKSESKRGTFTCRIFEQTLKLEDSVETARATACRTETTGWTRSF